MKIEPNKQHDLRYADVYKLQEQTMQELINNVIQWANDRNLIKGSTPHRQGLKLMSEYGELCDSIAKNDINGIKDGIGDVAVVAIIINRQLGSLSNDEGYKIYMQCIKDNYHEMPIDEVVLCMLGVLNALFNARVSYLDDVLAHLAFIAEFYDLTLEQCLEHAYNEIKDRKGVIYESNFHLLKCYLANLAKNNTTNT